MLRGNEPASTITVRAFIATSALEGLLADPETRHGASARDVADLAVAHADALIARLNGAGGPPLAATKED